MEFFPSVEQKKKRKVTTRAKLSRGHDGVVQEVKLLQRQGGDDMKVELLQ